ncbi:type II secretion system F family protein [Piscinibacter sp.]|uniref:type II secretion system F family protein n=1 Tax=Piscinibacter sp. TaxID=1903157 RepID=UPI0037838A8C
MNADTPRAEHELTLLKGGEALFPAMVEAIAGARSEVMLETYIFDFAHSALSVAEALERAARQQQADLSTRLSAAVAIFEPALIVAMGVLVLAIVLAILSMSQALDLEVLAEGVETPIQREFLRRELEKGDWNVKEVARRLELARSHVYNLIRTYGLSRNDR